MHTHPNRPARRHRGRTARRLLRAALFSAVRGLAYTAGTAVVPLILWWINTH